MLRIKQNPEFLTVRCSVSLGFWLRLLQNNKKQYLGEIII